MQYNYRGRLIFLGIKRPKLGFSRFIRKFFDLIFSDLLCLQRESEETAVFPACLSYKEFINTISIHHG